MIHFNVSEVLDENQNRADLLQGKYQKHENDRKVFGYTSMFILQFYKGMQFYEPRQEALPKG